MPREEDQEKEFYQHLTTETLKSQKDNEAAEKELARREIRDNFREFQDIKIWEENLSWAAKQLVESTERIREHGLDIKQDFEDSLGRTHNEFFSNLLSSGNYKAAEIYARETQVDSEYIRMSLEDGVLTSNRFRDHKNAFSVAELLGREDLMEELAEPVYESLDVEARPLFLSYLDEIGIDSPESVEDSVENVESHYDDKSSKIKRKISELERELEKTECQKESYGRFL